MHPRIESIDDDEMREFDLYEHQELAQGIPSNLGTVCALYIPFVVLWLLFL